jgi:integrase
LTEMKRWCETTRVQALSGQRVSRSDNVLAGDVAHYLEQVRSMPTYKWRKADLDRWIDALGPEMDRREITPTTIRAQLERWRADGYAANTVNHRRTALMHLFTILDGRSAPNPAKDVQRYRPEDRGPRFMSPNVLQTILDHMKPSQTKARLSLMRWTGWPQMTLARLTPTDIRWDEAVYVRRRRKGHGVTAEWLPLIPQAWEALREFKRMGCWGSFSRDSMNASWKRAVANTIADPRVRQETKDAIVSDSVPYDLRHSWATLLAMVTRDDTAVGKALQHSDARQTAHYMKAAGDLRLAAGLSKVASELPRLLKQAKRPENAVNSGPPKPKAAGSNPAGRTTKSPIDTGRFTPIALLPIP